MESAFQFRNPALVNLEFGINEEFTGEASIEVQTTQTMTVQVSKKEKDNEAFVSLTLEIGKRDSSSPCYIIATEVAEFKWGDEINEDRANQLLNQNAPALLLSYLRPIVAQVTSASPFEQYNIPFINFKRE